ncbi:hypothetical protein HWV62_17220 [Athelia sp. TMB]|nr:hypothetical protein HWV62_17220 [Athelia sp. TMB]
MQALKSSQISRLRSRGCVGSLYRRRYATVDSAPIIARPPPPAAVPVDLTPTSIDDHILAALHPGTYRIPQLINQSQDRAGHVLNFSLPYEPSPASDRRCAVDTPTAHESAVAMISHCVRRADRHKITLCSGFAVQGPKDVGSLIIRRSPVLQAPVAPLNEAASGTFVISSGEGGTIVHPVSSVQSALHKSDLLLLSKSGPALRTLPVYSPYPAPMHTRIRAHFVVHQMPKGGQADGWTPWVGGTWSKWVRGRILGYRDFAGREAEPGTYDSLSHLLFEPLPTAGSSGGPIIDEDTGAVVGVILGTRMDNRVEGVRGWGSPAESIFELTGTEREAIMQLTRDLHDHSQLAAVETFEYETERLYKLLHSFIYFAIVPIIIDTAVSQAFTLLKDSLTDRNLLLVQAGLKIFRLRPHCLKFVDEVHESFVEQLHYMRGSDARFRSSLVLTIS